MALSESGLLRMRLVFKLVRMAVLYVSHHYITGIRWYDDWRSVVLVSHLHNKQALIGFVECRHSPLAIRLLGRLSSRDY